MMSQKKKHFYRNLQERQCDIVQDDQATLMLPTVEPTSLPAFTNHIVSIGNFLPRLTLLRLQNSALTQPSIERSYIPGHKQGGTVSYAMLHTTAPEIIAFYLSPALHRICSAIVGTPVMPTPIHDQVSCALLFYDRVNDHIGWHYDYNFYHGRHFTALLSLWNQHLTEERLSSARLVVSTKGHRIDIPTPVNTFVLFEGAYIYHQVTRLGAQEKRVLLSMTFCTDPTSSTFKNALRKCKDTAYFGLRALWS